MSESLRMINHGHAKHWQTNSARPLTTQNLKSVLSYEIPALILPGFMSKSDCDKIVSNLIEIGMGTYAHVSHAVGRMGLAQMEHHLKGTKEGYFREVAATQDRYSAAIKGALNPVEKLMSHLRHACEANVGVATESGLGEMFAGTFRNVMTVGHKHFDFAPIEAQGWEIDQIQSQLSWNLYLNEPEGGGLKVYDRIYSPEDEAFRVAGQYFYDDKIVSGRMEFSYTPKIGDIVIFNSRNIHEVKPVTGDRFSLSSFIGQKKDGSLILWS